MNTPSASNGGWSVLVGASNEADLIEKSRAGDHTSYVSLIQLHDAHLRRFAFNSCGSTAVMDDVLEQVYLEAYSALRAEIDEPPFGTWLFRRVFDGCDAARSNLGNDGADDYTDDLDSELALALLKMPLDDVAAISMVAGEQIDQAQAAALLSTEVKPFKKMVSAARSSLNGLDLGDADELIAGHQPARHYQDFWNTINRSFGPAKTTQTIGKSGTATVKAQSRRWFPRMAGFVAVIAASIIALVAMFGGSGNDANTDEGSAPAPLVATADS